MSYYIYNNKHTTYNGKRGLYVAPPVDADFTVLPFYNQYYWNPQVSITNCRGGRSGVFEFEDITGWKDISVQPAYFDAVAAMEFGLRDKIYPDNLKRFPLVDLNNQMIYCDNYNPDPEYKISPFSLSYPIKTIYNTTAPNNTFYVYWERLATYGCTNIPISGNTTYFDINTNTVYLEIADIILTNIFAQASFRIYPYVFGQQLYGNFTLNFTWFLQS